MPCVAESESTTKKVDLRGWRIPQGEIDPADLEVQRSRETQLE